MSNQKETVQRTLLVAFLVCLVCSVFVATVAVTLKPIQQVNRALDTQRSIVNVAGIDASSLSNEQVQALFGTRIVPKLVELKTGLYSDAFDPNKFDVIASAKDPALSESLAAGQDIASIRRIEKYSVVYLVKDDDGKLSNVVFPIRGYGLWGTLYGFMSLANDFNTIVALSFHDHSETPGLGGEVDNPKWKALWHGKKVFKDNKIAIEVIKGNVSDMTPDADYKVDGLAGATLTSNGVKHLVHFWMDENGFGPFINKLRAGEIQ